MKKLLIGFLLTLSATSFACPDHSGTYELTADMGILLQKRVEQYECSLMKITLLDETGQVEYLEYDYVLDGKFHQGVNAGQELMGEFDQEVFHWIEKYDGEAVAEGWEELLENGDIQRTSIQKLPSGQMVTTTNTIKRIK